MPLFNKERGPRNLERTAKTFLDKRQGWSQTLVTIPVKGKVEPLPQTQAITMTYSSPDGKTTAEYLALWQIDGEKSIRFGTLPKSIKNAVDAGTYVQDMEKDGYIEHEVYKTKDWTNWFRRGKRQKGRDVLAEILDAPES